MKRSIILCCLVAIAFCAPLGAISFWEGTAVASSYGEFPQAGLYAACSSFPRNTLVEVMNLENGKSVQVLVTRGLDNPGVFIALSPEAASGIDIAMGMVARVKVSLPQNTADTVLRGDSPGRSLDPDLNPQALVDRERAKPDSGLSPVEEAEPAKTAVSGQKAVPEKVAIVPETAKTEKPAEPAAKAPKSQGEKAAAKPTPEKPDAIGVQRTAPLSTSVALLPESLPETPLEEKTPVAVEARTDLRDGQRADAVPEGQGASTDKTATTPIKPDAIPAKVALPEKAEVLERNAASLAEKKELSQGLAMPELAPREKPESALTRLTNPAATQSNPSMAKALPELEIPPSGQEKPEEKAEALTLLKKGGPKSAEASVASMALPGVAEAESAEVASAEERLVVIRKSPLDTALSLAEPEISVPDAGTVQAEERLLASRVRPGNPELSLADPQIASEEKEIAMPEERLLASRKSPGETSLSLADPELGAEPVDDATAEERLLASRKAPLEAKLSLADPELAAQEKAAVEMASAEVRLKAEKRNPNALVARIPDPELTEVSLAVTEERPPEALSAGLAAPASRKSTDSTIAFASPELPLAEAAPVEEGKKPEITLVERPVPESARDMLSFEKASPDLSLAMEGKVEEAPRPVVEKKPAEEKKPVEKTEPKVEVVESYRKGAEALAALNVQRLEKLSKGMYFVQVGVYRSGSGAATALKGLTAEYPLSYQEIGGKDAVTYHVFVGPLKKDESGIMLYRLKSLGFKDAFVRKGD